MEVINVHGHNSISDFFNRLEGPKSMIYLPYCSNYGILEDIKHLNFRIEYIDTSIFSQKNKVFVYSSVSPS